MPPVPPLSPLATLRWSVVASILDELRPARVLEIGCGQGGFGARIARRTSVYVGIEPDQQSYDVAVARIAPAGGRVVSRLTDLPPGEKAFDVLCAFEVLEHLDDDAGALGEWAKSLRPGGSILMSVPARPDHFSSWDEAVGHRRRYTPDDVQVLMAKIGCERIRPTLYGWPLGFFTEWIRKQVADRRPPAATSSMARTASSGRVMQPKRVPAGIITAAVSPFVALQRRRPDTGVGIVAVGQYQPPEPG